MFKPIIHNIFLFFYSNFSSNVYLIKGDTEFVLIDSGSFNNASQLLSDLEELGVNPNSVSKIFHTHGHADHFGADSFFKNAEVFMSEKDSNLLSFNEFSFIELFSNNSFPKTSIINFNNLIKISPFELKPIPCPGHTSGGICFFDEKNKLLFSGDTIFSGSVGRTDLFSSNEKELFKSIQKLRELDLDWLLPGHGEPIQGSEKIKKNFEECLKVFFNQT